MTRTSLMATMIFCFPLAAVAQEPLPPGIRAGIEAYQEAEAQRRAAVQQQIELNDALRYRLPWATPFGETIYYSGYAPAYGYRPIYYGGFYNYPSLYAGTFGYTFTPAIRQPIGQRQVQTSPRRWESYPVYGEEPPEAVEEPAPKPRLLREF